MNNRKRKVLQSSKELFVEKGIQQTSIQDILNHAGISKGTFYNYFSSKNECVLVILEQSRYEANLRRSELLIGKDITDIEVLIEQISVLVYVNEEQHIWSLFEAVFTSTDTELKKMVASHRLHELEWLANRMVDVYGEEARPYTFECAVLFYGMMQHLMMTWRNAHLAKLDPIQPTRHMIRNIDLILKEMIRTGEAVFEEETVQLLLQKIERQDITFDIIHEQLAGFIEGIHVISSEVTPIALEYAEYLYEELSNDSPRYFIIENILKPFHQSFNGTPHLAEAKEISSRIWYLIKTHIHSSEI